MGGGPNPDPAFGTDPFPSSTNPSPIRKGSVVDEEGPFYLSLKMSCLNVSEGSGGGVDPDEVGPTRSDHPWAGFTTSGRVGLRSKRV